MQLFEGSDHIPLLGPLLAFQMVFDPTGIHERAAMGLLHFFMKLLVGAVLKEFTCLFQGLYAVGWSTKKSVLREHLLYC